MSFITIQLRRDTAANWTSAAPVLALGEVGLETDTKKFKVGDGSTAWAGLAYWSDASAIDALTGDVTATGPGSVAATIANDAVTLAKMANMATASLIYRKTAGTGDPEVNTLATVKTDLGLTGTNSGDQTITLTGDVTGSGTGSFAATIAASAVTNAKMANMAAHTVKANITGSSAAPADSSLSDIFDAELASVQGDLIYRGASAWAALATATAGYVLKTNGAAADPSWLDLSTLYYSKTQIDALIAPLTGAHTFDGALAFRYVPGDLTLDTTRGPLARFVYTRASPAYRFTTAGYIERVVDNEIPVSTINGVTVAVFAAAATNVVQWSEDYSQWTAVSTPTLTSGQSDVYGLSEAYNISDTSGVNLQGVKLTIGAFSVNGGLKGFCVAIKKGSSSAASGSVVKLFDTTATADILKWTITWSAGLPSVVANTGTFSGYITLAGGWFLLVGYSAAWTAGHPTEAHLYPAGTAAEQGDCYFGAVCAEDNKFWTGVIPTNGLARTRAADTCTLTPHGEYPRSRTLYMKTLQMATAVDASSSHFFIGNNTNGLLVGGPASTTTASGLLFCSSVSKSVTVSGLTALAFGQEWEYRISADNTLTPAATLGVALNGGSETTGTSATNGAYSATYGSNVYTVRTNSQLVQYVSRILDLRGVQTLATCRTYFP